MPSPAQETIQLEKHQVFRIVKYRILHAPALLILTCLFFPLSVFGNQLVPYTDNASAEFELTDTKGHTHSLSDYRGKVVLVNFWASWCPPCIYEMPELKKLKEHFADRPFEILAINVVERNTKSESSPRSSTLTNRCRKKNSLSCSWQS